MSPRTALLLAALPLAALHLPAHADDFSALQSLPGIDSARIAIPDGSIAGHSVVVFELHSRRAPREALAEIERHWRKQGADTVLQAQTDDWFVLSRLADPARAAAAAGGAPGFEGFETLQLRASPGGGSEGLLARWVRAAAVAPAGDPLGRLVPADAQLVRQLSSGGERERRAATIVAHFARSLDDTERHLERHLLLVGYEPMRANDKPRDLRWNDDRARFYRSVNAELLVTLHRQPQGASAVLHHVETPR
ncbi:MAG: hypothetical protein ROZ64_14645 [Burkholderiaceae bacterium]|jgi:hypothetical protein|nr:hypothetical protein [Burkholderiaceae bacterium]